MISTEARPMFSPGALANALTQQANSSGSGGFDANVAAQVASFGGFGAFLAKTQSEASSSSARSGKSAPVQVQVGSFKLSRTIPSDAYISKSTSQLVRSIRLILSGDAVAIAKSLPPLETLYKITDHLVTYLAQDRLRDLYDAIKMEMERAAGAQAATLRDADASQASPESHISWLTQLQATWCSWCENVTLVRNVLLPLDRHISAKADASANTAMQDSDTAHLPIWDLALDIFGHRILKDETLAQMILNRVVTAIDAERQGSFAYRATHASIAEMFSKLHAEKMLDRAIEAATAAFYKQESATSIDSMAPGDYLVYADRRIAQEEERSQWCLLRPKGKKANVAAARQELIAQHAEKIYAGLPQLISESRLDELSKVYVLIKSIDQLPQLRKGFGDYIKVRGEAIVNDRAKDDEMIERLLSFKASIDSIVVQSFQKDKDFVNAQKDSFEVFINKRENKPAELIAKFLDIKLRSGNKTMTDEELEHTLDEALILFRYTHAKDMFEEFYKRYFAKRLLLNRSASSDAEKSMLLKLKEECGAGFTAKLETMIKDVEVSKDLMDEYERFVAKKVKEDGGQPDQFDLSVSVLTQAHWPTYPQLEVVLPKELSTAAERFAEFYQTRNSGRRLDWQHSLGTLSLLTSFPKAGQKELHVSTFQAIVLLLFANLEAGDKLSYKDIKTETGLEDKELKRTLQSLACGQIPTRVLRKIPQGKDVEEGDEFCFNDNFKNERHRIRINQIQMKETAEEQKSTEQRVFLDRELILQAAAVRVLKARKTIKHSELITEVVDQIKSRFSVDVAEIKKVFEILIEKEYMERVDGQRGMYRYLA